MNKQTIDKARFFLGGVVSRAEESTDFFESIDVDFTAGMKQFSFKAELSDKEKGLLSFIFSGEKYELRADALADFVLEKMKDYCFCKTRNGYT